MRCLKDVVKVEVISCTIIQNVRIVVVYGKKSVFFASLNVAFY